ncbi:inosine guanosine and xanthosine phosphorylase family [Niastella koreensis GR20-10]|uniref:Purine nucleoside phosphorylase n=2 Tax=Niastella koreensis TaxID=354356 RepID=G8TLL9_NIAKG|nr:inosine guanosine and xanthosine phosphorylase family [Niastella koreensis GR20-10]
MEYFILKKNHGMDHIIEKIAQTSQFLEEKGFTGASTAIVLGTGLGSFIDRVEVIQQITYNEIPHFPTSTVESHKGKLILARVGNKKILVMQGRFHYYEGYSMQQITFPVRVFKALGVTNLLLSNASGGMNPEYKMGDLVLLTDHINLQPENPLRGVHEPGLGPRFPDMSQPYDIRLNKVFIKTALELSVPLKQGVYVAVPGPNLETRAEYRFLRVIGADMVGMSTVPEVIVASQIGLSCAAVSVITDECDPDNLQPVNIEEIIAVAAKADQKLSSVFKSVIEQL